MDISFGSIVLRASIIYLYVLILMRLSGKRSIGQLTAMDFVVATIIGDQFDGVIYGEVPIVQGLVGFGVIVFWHFVANFASSRSTLIDRLLTSPPTVLVQNGSYLKTGLDEEWMNVETVQSELRLNGEDQLEEIKEARLEPSGQLSLIKNEPSKPAQKQDFGLSG